MCDGIHLTRTANLGKEPLPAGVGTGERYAKRLINGTDSTFFVRPKNWRCSRRHSPEGCRNENVEYGQYEYKPQYIENDEKVAYSNPKYPWLVAAAKYKIAYKRPQDYDLVMLKFGMLRLGIRHSVYVARIL